jgi:peptidoglycan/LPS O-acetylase OafA/YrhL
LTVYCAYWLGPVLTTLPLETYLKHPQTVGYLGNISAWRIQYVLPGVFATNPLPDVVNGSLWSMPYEIRCYLALTVLWVLPIPRRATVTGAVIVLGLLLCSMPPIPTANPEEQYLGLTAVKLGLYFFVGAWFGMWRTTVRPTLWLGAILVGVSCATSPSNVQTAMFVFGFAVFVLALGSRPGLLPNCQKKWAIGHTVCFYMGFPCSRFSRCSGWQTLA